jgi:hypothetical protein
MDDNGSEPQIRLGHMANRRMLAVLSDIKLEQHEHGRRLDLIYEELLALNRPAPVTVGGSILAELSRHHTADGHNVAALREIVDPDRHG